VLSCWLLIHCRSQQIIRESFEVVFVIDYKTVPVFGLFSAFFRIRKGRMDTYKSNLMVLMVLNGVKCVSVLKFNS